jgi:hypothetical protein
LDGRWPDGGPAWITIRERDDGVQKRSPTITLLYTQKKIPDQHIEPISWIVDEFVLVDSLYEETTHNLIRRFPLRG